MIEKKTRQAPGLGRPGEDKNKVKSETNENVNINTDNRGNQLIF